MKCDELKKYKAYEFGGAFVYHINEVDEAIAELKDKLQLDEDEMAGFLQLEEECGGGDLRNYIAELKAENKMLKEHIANGDVSRITWIDEVTELKAENERLKDELRPGEYDEFYLKYEADKVIAELKADYKEACDRLQTANLIKDEQLAATRHQKYKRCLAMYRYCAIKALYELDYKGNDVKWKWYSKWMHKWYKLAKHYREAK